jgi:hypothetical protein
LLYYSEECEAYGPMEFGRALAARDERELRLRARQVVNGLLGGPGFRFFVAGTAASQLHALGLELVRGKVDHWRGIPAVEHLWCRTAAPPSQESAHPDEHDYYKVEPDFEEVRSTARRLMSERPYAGFTRAQQEDLERRAGAPNRFAPLLMFLPIADAVLPRLSLRASVRERITLRMDRVQKRAESSWEGIESMYNMFERAVGSASGEP